MNTRVEASLIILTKYRMTLTPILNLKTNYIRLYDKASVTRKHNDFNIACAMVTLMMAMMMMMMMMTIIIIITIIMVIFHLAEF